MLCEKCSKVHDGEYGSGRFCSRSCANSRTWSVKDKEKKSIAAKKYIETHGGKIGGKLNKSSIEKMRATQKRNYDERLLEADFSSLRFDRLRRRIILEQNGKCNRCQNTHWLGEPIPLEIEHIDGDNKNNSRENVEALCCNCHALTTTWRGRNKQRVRNVISDDEVIDAYCETGNIHQCLLKLGLAAKGGNYGRVKRCLTQFGIDWRTGTIMNE